MKKLLLISMGCVFSFVLAAFSTLAGPPDHAKDKIPWYAEKELITVLNPTTATPDYEVFGMKPRFDTLDGKKVYIVCVGFCSPLHDVLPQELQEVYPNTTWIPVIKAGATWDDDPELWAEIKDAGAGAILHTGQSSTVGPQCVERCATLEEMGVPTVVIGTDAFETILRGAALAFGFPHLRISFLEQPVAGSPEEVVLEKIRGNDPISGNPFLQQLYAQFTAPLTEEEAYSGLVEGYTPPRLLEPDTAENLEAFFYNQGWTDGAPIVLPTEERVAAMIAGSNRGPTEHVGEMSCNPFFPDRSYNVEQVAVNAVMAGAKPEHFPVILAIAVAGEPSLFSSTTSSGLMVVVNGPIAKEVNMNGGIAALGPWNQANAVIGRAYQFISRNLGYGVPGVSVMATIGNVMNYNNATICENEELLPEGWDPLHVTTGFFAANESCVSIFAGWEMRSRNVDGWQPLNYQTGPGANYARMAEMSERTGPTFYSAFTLLLDPSAAENLSFTYETRQDFMQYLRLNSYMSRNEFFRGYPSYIARARGGEEPYASWYALPKDHRVPVLKYDYSEYGNPEVRFYNPELQIVVVGGGNNPFYWASNLGLRHMVAIDQFRPNVEWAPIEPPRKTLEGI